VIIRTSGAEGIFAESLGTPEVPATPDLFLGVRIPGDPGVDGGEVLVESYSNVETVGDGAHGISAHSATTGYSQLVISGLEDFSENGFTFQVTSLENPDGTPGVLGEAVAGVVLDPNTGDPLTDDEGNPVTSGTFVVNSDGTYEFNLPDPSDPDNPINMLADGESLQTRVRYVVLGTNPEGTDDDPDHGQASLVVMVTREGESLITEPEAYFDDRYGISTKPTPDADDPEKVLTVFPDLTQYVNSLLDDATAGGAGNSVTITSAGAIKTQGLEAYGIYAQTEGGSGSKGRGGSISHSAGQGGTGKKGGTITIIAGGSITTADIDSAGIIALTRGGSGGDGGDGGFWRFGARGGTGGDGGDIAIGGIGKIETAGDSASGIIALSTGGEGGNGGDGSVFTGGQSGGYGGKGGAVTVEGNWTITTQGNKAHGIWAKSTGGNAGAGGSGGWISGSPGGGGQATDGGAVTITSGGRIETFGSDAFGIYGQSVGGFGGQGGEGRGIFYAAGGDGNSAGSGGAVSINNQAGGIVTTSGERSHAIFGQSVGGGGGSGGGAGALVGLGGEGGAGGNGGSVLVENAGELGTGGDYAYGILAQSVGGGGGDGGSSGGLVAFGGTGTGGGDGGGVEVTTAQTSLITTTGVHSYAILAQSIGGGGGTGGGSGGFAAIGGSGSGGGEGDKVTVINQGRILASGAESIGIFAESVGGGGGDGGSSGGAFAVGGSGSATSNGGAVEVTNSGDISSASSAIFAQSIGGGGGNGGSSGGWFSFGGSGGGGGSASTVSVSNAGSLTTSEINASAIFAQSVGGGGGNGGNSSAVGAFGSLAIGGSGDAGGNGAAVSVDSSTGSISTSGDNARGIHAQSVGGGGGNGGFATAASVGIGASVSVSVGGDGGGGGSGSTVLVDSVSDISTSGSNAHGISAQSIGGGGGSGGFAIAAALSDTFAAALGLGGDGGDGGISSTVTVGSSAAHTSGTISTSGEHAYGIHAQSVGGSGGDAGFSIAASGAGAVAASLSLGGDGGVGGSADAVSIFSGNTVSTRSDNSHGLFAQSLGGGGGSGGFSVSGSVAGTGSLGASFGGSGGGGASAGNVRVDSSGDNISTGGNNASGIIAQSLGGSGGDGGFSVAGGISGTAAVNFSMGGSGGEGGTAGTVVVNSSADIDTSGDDSLGIFAQSLGGGGGNGSFSVTAGIGGSASVGASLGGSGGEGAVANTVTVTTTGSRIDTRGNRSTGIQAQSVGGSGGNGGFSVAGGISKSASVNFAMGGSGGAGSAGGAVWLSASESITTLGSDAHGIFAQSLGGGGGSGGFGISGGISASGAAIGAALGGKGGDGATASTVTVNSSGDSISTGGARSYGIFAQSVGGSGGDGGFSVAGGISKSAAVNFAMGGSGGNGSHAGDVILTSSNQVATIGDDAHGIFAQSLGGGGGSGGFSVTGGISTNSAQVGASIGGAGGSGSTSGQVTVSSTGARVDTLGDRAYGILAQSIGGSGGDGGFSVAGGISKSASVNFAMGGSGGTGSLGGGVDLTNSGIVTTLGDNAHGLFAQSLGGGGGSGGFSVAGGLSTDSPQIAASIGGYGGAGGNSSTVTLNSSGDSIATAGDRAYGILAQSIGGGGGDGGFSIAGGMTKKVAVNFSLGGRGGAAGDAGTVSVGNSNAITTLGDMGYAIFAQSVGGGGGSGGYSASGTVGSSESARQLSVAIGGDGGSGGNADVVKVTNSAVLNTFGDQGTGIFAQSVGGGGGDGGNATVVNKSLGDGGDTDTEKSWTLSIAVGAGGSSGSAGNASAVTVDNTNSISSRGDSALGILAQSIGGGGGNGGIAATEGSGGSGDTAIGLNLSLGGAAGGGGNGDMVEVTSEGKIVTLGAGSHGIMAQSVGGGGGKGGASLVSSAAPNADSKFALNLNAAFGGSGGDGGDGAVVEVTNQGLIDTSGDGAYAILAQSIGGGGGHGGDATVEIQAEDNDAPPATGGGGEDKDKSVSVGLSLGVGGAGHGGGTGAAVTVTNVGDLVTRGAGALGIFAQSVGGGGGAGGMSATAGSGGKGDTAIDLTVSLGGKAGGGGAADKVTVTNSGSILTGGADSHGIFAQSVGGGGGKAGASIATGGGDGGSVALGFGGSGGGGGNADAVTVQNTGGVIFTSGVRSHGIFAQSVGGGGGSGGYSLAGVTSNLTALALSFGGAGGDGGKAGSVEVTSSTDISTQGDDSHGIFAQSVGGGGGSGGFNLGASLAGSKSLALGFGGSGGGGGSAADVSVTSSSDLIQTFGDRSHGIFAQSVGGGGGSGGISLAGSLSDIGELTLSIGGSGGDGGDGGDVSVINDSTILVEGNESYTILAQSIGGGGGTGGIHISGGVGDIPILNIGFGGSGNVGRGGKVTVVNKGELVMAGEDRIPGVLAQSIGGGGGTGGVTIGGNLELSSVLSLDLGSDSAVRNDARVVNVESLGWIETGGDDAPGILSQSIGAGGGASGLSVGGDLERSPLIDVAFGGSGAGGAGRSVTLTSSGESITTYGHRSAGILAQSIGGGGGSGGIVVVGNLALDEGELNVVLGSDNATTSDAAAVSVESASAISTLGDYSSGILAQSLGGGGGAGGINVGGGLGGTTSAELALGGTNVLGGDADSVTIANTGARITTQGDRSSGIFAQSIGGGGGVGWIRNGETSSAESTRLIVGARGESVGNGGSITVGNNADIAVSGDGAYGILAQSIGGGGGVGSNGVLGETGDIRIGGSADTSGRGGKVVVTHSGRIKTVGMGGYGILAQSIGQAVGSSGDGDKVSVDSDGAIVTTGDGAIGILAQSVGGGGGLAERHSNAAKAFAGSTGGFGSGGDVRVVHQGDITTQGRAADGIYIQSAGGQGNAVSRGMGGSVDVTVSGDILAQGEDSDGIVALSNGTDGSGDIRINILGGTVEGGSGSSTGVRFVDGADNRLDNQGTVMTLAGISGTAILAGAGSEAIDNAGTVSGSVDLGTGNNSFYNREGAQFDSGRTVALGSGNRLTNAGILSPGDADFTLATNLDGDFVQTAAGTYAIDMDLASEQTDRITASGAADLAGLAEVNIVNPGSARPGTQQHTIFSGETGVTDSGLELGVQPSAVIDYQLRYPNGTDVVLDSSIDFAADGLNRNQTAIGNHVNAIQQAGGSESFSPITAALVGQPDVKSLSAAYDQLSPEVYLDTSIASLFSNLQFNDAMLSCRERRGDYRFVREGECRWMRLSTRRLDRNHTRENSDFDEWAVSLAGGMQKAIGGPWHAGFALSYERSNLDNDNGAESDGDKLQAGAIIKGRSDATTYSVAMSSGYGWYDTKRDIDFLPTHERAKGDQEIGFASAHARLTHDFERDSWYLRPQIDAGITYVDLDDFSERGAGGANLDVEGHDETYLSLQPAVEIGRELKRRDGTLVRPFVKVGVTHFFSGTTPEIKAIFQGAPAGVSPFTVKGDIDETFADVSLGLDVLKEDGINFRLNYLGQFSDNMKHHSLGFKVTVPF
jgi:hypothetical protein